MTQLIPTKITEITEDQAAWALREAWRSLYGHYPSNKSLAILWAQSALETGRWRIIRNYNFGNIRKKSTDKHDWCQFECSEVLGGKEVFFYPPDDRCNFRAYPNMVAGAEDYLRFVSAKTRYRAAWAKVVAGDPEGYVTELKKAGYFTASEKHYRDAVVRLTTEFHKREEELLSWKPLAIVKVWDNLRKFLKKWPF